MGIAAVGVSLGVNLPVAEPVKQKTVWDHCVEYVSSSAGIYDLSTFGKSAIDWLTKLPQLTSSQEPLNQTRSVLHITSTVATIPYLASTATTSVERITKLVTLHNPAAPSAPGIESRIQKAAYKAFVSLCTTISAATDTLSSFHDANWIDLGKTYPLVNGIFFVTNIVSEGADLSKAVDRVQKNQNISIQPVSEERKDKAQKQITLSFIQMVKNISSIAGAVLGLISLGVAVMIGGISVLPLAGLVLSSVWITTSIGMHFYKKLVVEAPLLPR